MIRQHIEQMLKEMGWVEDSFGHFKKDMPTRTKSGEVTGSRRYRLKMQTLSLRLEVELEHAASPFSKASKSWVRVAGDYYKNIIVTEDGRLKIENKLLGAKKK